MFVRIRVAHPRVKVTFSPIALPLRVLADLVIVDLGPLRTLGPPTVILKLQPEWKGNKFEMFKTVIRSFFGHPKKSPKPVTTTSGKVMAHQKGQALAPIPAPEPETASASLQVGKTASPCATVVEFSDPPVEAGVVYVLAKRGHKIYTVDLNRLTCTCSQFSSTKRGMARNQVQKYCTHLFQQARRMGFCRRLTPNHELIEEYFDQLENLPFVIGDQFFLSTIDRNDILVVQTADTSWVDVLTRKKRAKDSTICTGEMERYGYNAPTNRWAYGEAPFHPMQIKAFLRSLPSLPSTSSHHEEIDTEFPLQDILKLDPLKGNAHRTLIDETFEHLRGITEVNLIESALTKLQTFEGVKRKRLASEWYEHGRNLQSQGHDRAVYFLRRAKEIDPKTAKKVEVAIASASSSQVRLSGMRNVAKSVAESKEIERKDNRARLARTTQDLLDVDAEEFRFNQLPDTGRKKKAEELVKTENPEWYSRDAGHTFRGYLYADFVRDNAPRRKSKHLPGEDATVIDYIASLAVLDGTISDGVMAEMFRVKGEIALDRNELAFALDLFRQALAYNPHVGVKRIVQKLEANKNP